MPDFVTGYSYRAVAAISGGFLAQYRVGKISDWVTLQTRGPRNQSSAEPVHYQTRRQAEAAAQLAGHAAVVKTK